MLPVFILAIIFLSDTAQCKKRNTANGYIEDLIKGPYADQIKLLKLDPADLQDHNTEIKAKEKITGEFTKGKLTGLLKAKKTSDCKLSSGKKSRQDESETIAINCTISYDNLQVNYEGRMKSEKVPWRNVKAHSKVTKTLIVLEIAHTPPMLPYIKAFNFKSMGELSIQFKDLGPLSKYEKDIKNDFDKDIDIKLFNFISTSVQYALNKAVAETTLPSESKKQRNRKKN